MDGIAIDGSLDPTLSWTCHLLLAIVFARAGFAKLRNPAEFTRALRGYAIVPEPLVAPAAAALLAIECLLVPALLVPAWASAASALATLALVLYTSAIAVNLARGRRDSDCGCSGPLARQSLHEWLVVRNLFYALPALAGTLAAGTRVLGRIDIFTIAVATASLFALAVATDQLAAFAARTRNNEVRQ